MNNKKTVTIGIPAHNEEKNKAKLLDCILGQKKDLYRLERLIVACDGCTDNTAEIVKSYMERYDLVEIIDDGRRLGQAGRLNEFYKINTSDIFITFDADVVLGSDFVIDEIVKSFTRPNIGLVGGCGAPATPQNFLEKIAVAWVNAWDEARHGFNYGDTVHNHHGCVSAISGRITNKVEIPLNIIANDQFLYHMVKKLGYNFRFAKNAVVYYKVPDNFKDYFIQSVRFITIKDRIFEFFGNEIEKEYHIPSKIKHKALIKVFFKKPFSLIAGIFLQMIIRVVKNRFKEEYKNGVWKTAESSKWNQSYEIIKH